MRSVLPETRLSLGASRIHRALASLQSLVTGGTRWREGRLLKSLH